MNHWANIATALQNGCEQCVDATAETAVVNIQRKIEANGQVDSGEMRDTIYRTSQRSSTYHADEHSLPEIPKPDSSTEANVAAAAEYSIYQDKGTVYIPARPFFDQGLDNTRGDFEKNMQYYVVRALEEAAK